MFRNIYKDKNWFTISNILTFIRILTIPFIIWGIVNYYWMFSFLLYLFAGIIDLADGYLARLLNQETFLGKALDPIADKLLTISSFATLAFIDSSSLFIPKWFVLIILFREIIILLGSFILLKKNINFKIKPNIWGKLTAFFQTLFIMWLFACKFFKWTPIKTYYILLTLLVLFSLIAFLQYFKIGLKIYLKED